MTIKSFFIGLLIAFVVYETLSITIGVIRKKKQQKLMKGDNQDVSNKD